MVFDRLEELSRLCGVSRGSVGVLIEDKNSGTILLQQVPRRLADRRPSIRKRDRQQLASHAGWLKR
jgi:hypothetical protein